MPTLTWPDTSHDEPPADYLRVLATPGSTQTLKVSDLRSFDEQGQRLLADWCQAVPAR